MLSKCLEMSDGSDEARHGCIQEIGPEAVVQ
jgi:hypothetical protein